eukprot:Skav212425  [mRNA]  locus=scaffold202:166690:171937:- [translate_table: standard]
MWPSNREVRLDPLLDERMQLGDEAEVKDPLEPLEDGNAAPLEPLGGRYSRKPGPRSARHSLAAFRLEGSRHSDRFSDHRHPPGSLCQGE